MSDATTGTRRMDGAPFRRPGSGTGRGDVPLPEGRIGRPRIPLLDRGLMACLALAGGLIWLLAGDSDPDAAPRTSVRELGRHESHVASLVLAPDGRILASCSLDGTVGLWSLGGEARPGGAARPSLVASLPHRTEVIDAAFSADGRVLVTVGFDALRFWSHGPGADELMGQLPGGLYRCLAIAPDGRTLAVGLIDGSIQLLDMPGGQRRSAFRAYSDKIARLAFSPRGRILASSSLRGEVKLWDIVTGQERGRVDVGSARFHALAFAPDGRTLALAEWQSNEGNIVLWDLEAHRLRARLAGHTDGIGQLAFSRDGRLLVSGGRDKKIMFWDPNTAEMLGMIGDAGGMVNSLALTPDGTQLAFVAGDDTVRLRDLADLVPSPGQP